MYIAKVYKIIIVVPSGIHKKRAGISIEKEYNKR